MLQLYSEIEISYCKVCSHILFTKGLKHYFHKFNGVSMHLNPTRLFNIPIKINDLIAIKCLQKRLLAIAPKCRLNFEQKLLFSVDIVTEANKDAVET